MDDDEPRQPKKYPLSISKLSKTPSWIMLGFVLGALFVIALPPMGDDKPAPPAAPVELPKPPTPAPPLVTTVQAVFEDPRWEGFASWGNDIMEIALWNPATRDFNDYYEVRRIGGVYYYRSIAMLTRPLIKNQKGLPEDSPLRFTYAGAQEFFEQARAIPPAERKPERDWKPAPQRPAVDLPRASAPNPAPPPALPKIEVQPKGPSAEK